MYFKDKSFHFVAWYLVIFNFLVFGLEILYPPIVKWGVFNSEVAFHYPYQFITALFLHATPNHVLENMFALFLFGILLEKVVGSKNFLLVYFLGGIAGNIAFMLINPHAEALGASGCIMSVLGALTVLRPRQIVYIYVPLPVILLTIIYALIDIFGLIHPYSNVGYSAHLGGLAFGVLWAIASYHYFDEEKEKEKKVKDMLIEDISEEEIEEWEKRYMEEDRKK